MSFRGLPTVVVTTLGAASLTACAPWPYEVTPPLHGFVFDATTHMPMAGARVRIQEFPETEVTAGGDGSFSIPGVRKWQVLVIGTDVNPGYRLAAVAPGYVVANQLWDAGGPREVTLLMRRSGTD